MEVNQFLRQLTRNADSNFFVVSPDNLGLLTLLPEVLQKVANVEDVYFIPAQTLSIDRARQLERDAQLAPRGSSSKNHFFIYGMGDLPPLSVGPLLKAVEEAKYARFIFQTQKIKRKLRTICSRCQLVSLPFLSRRVVFGNMTHREQDAQTADTLELYDGTLDGTIKALGMKDAITALRRELKRGSRGLLMLLSDDMIKSLAFKQVLWEVMIGEEKAYLSRWDTPSRRRLVAFLAARRKG